MSKELLSENTSRRIYREEDRILKVFSGDFPKEEVFHEAFINARIEAVLGEMVPKVLSLNLRDGSWTLEKEYAKGRTLQELMEEEPFRKQEYHDEQYNQAGEEAAASDYPADDLLECFFHLYSLFLRYFLAQKYAYEMNNR